MRRLAVAGSPPGAVYGEITTTGVSAIGIGQHVAPESVFSSDARRGLMHGAFGSVTMLPDPIPVQLEAGASSQEEQLIPWQD